MSPVTKPIGFERLSLILILLWVCWAVLWAPAGAKEQHLLSTSSDKDQKVETFAVEVGADNSLKEFWHREPSKPDRVYTLEQLQKGVVLKRESGEEAIRFFAIKVEPKKGGTFRMDYLYSAIPPKEYRSMTFDLRWHETQWRLFAAKEEKRPLKSLHFLTNVSSLLGFKKIIGIRAVELQY